MRRIGYILLGGMLIMTMAMGCNNSSSSKSDKEILSQFSSLIEMFPSEGLEYLYDKQGSLDNNDLGTWSVNSNVYYKNGDKLEFYGVDLHFNRNLRQARGYFSFDSRNEGDFINSKDYLIEYKNNEIILIDKIDDDEIMKKFEKFKLLFNSISLHKEYISKLTLKSSTYNENVPRYSLNYVLDTNDSNVQTLVNQYDELQIDENNIILNFDGSSSFGSTTGIQTVEISLDERSRVSAGISFSESDSFKDLFSEDN